MTTIWVTFQVEGWHRWPEAPLSERSYLRNDHRHMFHFRVEMEVKTAEREVELHDFRQCCLNRMEEYTPRSGGVDFEDRSCEQLAWEMVGWCQLEYIGRWVACEVSEDGECGARVEARP